MPGTRVVSAAAGLVPVLETARLRLRGHRADDFEAFAAIWADADVVRYIGGKPSTPQESWMRLLRYPGMWALLGYGFWAIEDKASGRPIGEIGYADFKRAIEPPLEGMPEMGWVLASDVHGKGYAREALDAVLAWGQQHFGPHRAACIIEPDNAASVRLATGVGFRFVREVAYLDVQIHVFVRDAV
ncbi:GNAT family N-acetyltransferase [Dyella sp. A6]|uniref:GNAT family N-acetyltransferase n=1 Tax=Dyella aluminiiresistens TaxID=3069105 RepID=UPI002E792393|nr:GNAT family N-acetyltransferase [Dyella sp. A6]